MDGTVRRTSLARRRKARGILPTTKAPMPREMKSLRVGKVRFDRSGVFIK
jgi:hypothetical protein